MKSVLLYKEVGAEKESQVARVSHGAAEEDKPPWGKTMSNKDFLRLSIFLT